MKKIFCNLLACLWLMKQKLAFLQQRKILSEINLK